MTDQQPPATPNAPAPGTALPWRRERSELLGADDTLIGLFLSSAQSFQTWHIDPAKAKLAHTPEAEQALEYVIHAANAYPALAAENARLIALVGDAYAAGQRDMQAAAIEVLQGMREDGETDLRCGKERIRALPLKDQP